MKNPDTLTLKSDFRYQSCSSSSQANNAPSQKRLLKPGAEKIILDCDTGHDDAVAILLAVGNPNIDLAGVTTVGGNAELDKVTYNSRAVLEEAEAFDVPVHRGCAQPLLTPLRPAAAVHGETGLDGVELPEPIHVPLQNGHAVNWIIDTIMASEPKTITLVCTGPLTNVALAARMEQAIIERVKRVVLMGGGVHEANSTPVAEFNIWTDPDAAKIVFDAPWDVTMVGLDTTHQALCTPEVQERIVKNGGEVGAFMSGLMDFFRVAYQENQDFQDPPVHDPCTIAYLIDPTVVKTRRCLVAIENQPGLTFGQTVADMRGPEDPSSHTQVTLDLDFDKFWRIVENAIVAINNKKQVN